MGKPFLLRGMHGLIKYLICLFCVVEGGSSQKILLMTVPKAGTHLMRKALYLLTEERTHWVGLQTKRFNVDRDLAAPHRITGAHLFPLFDPIRTSHLHDYKVVLMIRDPRDCMLSFCNHLRRGLFWTSCPTFDVGRFRSLSAEEQLNETLIFPTEYLNPAICFPLVSRWMQEPSVLVCRFEELIGPAGGGERFLQLETLRRLANHLGYEKTEEQLAKIADHLFGGTWTFYQGQIGKWKEGYSEENLQHFDALYGRYVQEWSYE